MSAAVIASVAVVACCSNRSSRDKCGDTFQLSEITGDVYRLDVSLVLKANDHIDTAKFLEYVKAYRQ